MNGDAMSLHGAAGNSVQRSQGAGNVLQIMDDCAARLYPDESATMAQSLWDASIAVAELIEALQALVASLSEHDDEGMIEHAEQMIAARAAIAKATGKKA